MRLMAVTVAVLLCVFATPQALAEAVFTGPPPGSAVARVQEPDFRLGNKVVSLGWTTSGGRFLLASITNGMTGATLTPAAEPFSLTLGDGSVVAASSLTAVTRPVVSSAKPEGPPGRASNALAGRQISFQLRDPSGRFTVDWRAVLRAESNYIRQQITLRPVGADLSLREVTLVDATFPNAVVAGTVQGSPVMTDTLFMAVEHPMSESTVTDGRVRCSLRRETPVKAGQSLVVSSVLGVSPAGQMRRSINYYIERERARPYKPFLNANTWFDIGYYTPYDESAAVDAISQYAASLTKKRGLPLDAYLLDDGWDDPAGLWKTDGRFPGGLKPVAKAAGRLGGALGVWLSLTGGYGEARDRRLAAGARLGLETTAEGFAVSGPNCYRYFSDLCLDMLRNNRVAYIKLDAMGSSGTVQPGSAFGSDFEAAVALVERLRSEQKNLFVNVTSAWPSPFWLQTTDCVWRGGWDHEFAGAGTDRQKWMTYRDADVYERVVKAAPVFPLSSLMLHGVIYARNARGLNVDPQLDFPSEVRSFFGSGTQMQELYLTPALLTEGNWDALEEAARWARRNQGVLVDTHWVGGDPAKLEVYGWASWSPDAAVLVLRNPSDSPQAFEVDIEAALELPKGSRRTWRAESPWAADRKKPHILLNAGTSYRLEMKPFEVVTLDLKPVR